jgi:hypothetical protein
VPEKPARNSLARLASATAEQLAVTADSVLWRAAEHLPFFARMVAKKEKEYALRQAALMLDICRHLQTENPGISGEALYEMVVQYGLDCDAQKARDIIRGADQSFAQWPDERDVNFRDICNYVIFHQLMAQHTKALGTRADMEAIIAFAIPEGL